MKLCLFVQNCTAKSFKCWQRIFLIIGVFQGPASRCTPYWMAGSSPNHSTWAAGSLPQGRQWKAAGAWAPASTLEPGLEFPAPDLWPSGKRLSLSSPLPNFLCPLFQMNLKNKQKTSISANKWRITELEHLICKTTLSDNRKSLQNPQDQQHWGTSLEAPLLV